MSRQELGGASAPSFSPLKGHVVLEPAYDSEKDRGLFVHPSFMQRYPQIGWCVATASEQVAVGDLCLINVESSDVARTYKRVLALHLKEWGTELFDPEVEPAIREAVERYRRNPTTADSSIKAEALNGDHFAFLASDVLSMEWTTQDAPEFSLLYPLHVRMAFLPEGMFYFVHEDDILGVIE